MLNGYKATVKDDMILTIDNSAPHVAPSGAGIYEINVPVYLTGQVSDFDGDGLSYIWLEGQDPLCSGTVATESGGTAVDLAEPCVVADFSLGMHTITLQVDDGVNTPVRSEMVLQIKDDIKPTLGPAADKTILWPPNHSMISVTILANATDNSGLPVTLTAVVSSNEPIDGLGDGDTAPDWSEPVIDQEIGVIYLQLRAERSGAGNGRAYSIAITATDVSDNSSTANVKIIVPHDKGKK